MRHCGRYMASLFCLASSSPAVWLAIFAMASIKASTMLLPLACDHCSVPGGDVVDVHRKADHCSVPGGDVVDVHRKAKQQIQLWKAAGWWSLPDLLYLTRAVDDHSFRAAILMRLSDRLSSKNCLKLALATEARASRSM